VYSNPAASGLFIQAVHSRCYEVSARPSRQRNVLRCLRGVHKEQSGPLLTLLIDELLAARHAGVRRLWDSVACRRVEMLLAEDKNVSMVTLNQYLPMT